MTTINTTNYMLTFPEFNHQLTEVFPEAKKFNSKNWTTQQHAGWTEALYEAQDFNSAVEYMQKREWRYHFNGVIGEGATLTEAIKNHQIKYDEHLIS